MRRVIVENRCTSEDNVLFQDAVQGLCAGDFSRLEPLFDKDSTDDHLRCRIIVWNENDLFANAPRALEEAMTCACFLGRMDVAAYLIAQGVDASGGANTGLNSIHWAANRGQLEAVMLLINCKVPFETRSRYGSTVLGTAVWSAINEPRAEHLCIIEELLKAGALLEGAGYPTGNEPVDELLKRYGAA